MVKSSPARGGPLPHGFIIAASCFALLAGAGCKGAKNPDPGAAISKCQAALSGAGGGAGSLVDAYLTGCSDVYSVRLCHDAMDRAALANPADKLISFVEPCRLAYCPLLEPPLPAICAKAPGTVGVSDFASWPELNDRILERELGARATLAKGLAALMKPTAVAVAPGASGPPAPVAFDLEVTVTVGDGGALVSSPQGERLLRDSSFEQDGAALTASFPRTKEGSSVVLHCHRDVKFKVIKQVMAGLADAGYSNISFNVMP